MLTVALGFAAAENVLFLLTPIADGNYSDSLVTGNLRFLGSTLLHVVASSVVGFSLAFFATRQKIVRTLALSVGLILATALHLAFNTLIMDEGDSMALMAFFLVWSLAVIFFAVLEILKYFEYRSLPNDTCPS
jgi:RsiW-degrading membrane proteinase PrsW (M82 family)